MPELQKVSFQGGLHVDFFYSADCYNPNPYHVTVRSARATNVYMGKQIAQVASVMQVPEVVLPARGSRTIKTFVDMSPTARSFNAMFGRMFSTQTAIYLEASLELMIDVDLFVTRLQAAKNFTRDCGFNMQVFRSALAKVGPMACADSFETLELPDVGDQASAGKLGLSAKKVAKEEVEQGERAKDIGLWTAMVGGAVLGMLLLCSGCGGCCLRCCCSPKDSRRSRGDEHCIMTEDELQRKAEKQAKELRGLREQLAEAALHRQYAEQERQLRHSTAKLAKDHSDGLDDLSADVSIDVSVDSLE